MDETLWELQAKALYSVIVAGKSAKFADAVIKRLVESDTLPFDTIKEYIGSGVLWSVLRTARTGNYTKLEKCFPRLIELNPATCTVDDLEDIPGIGPKTARFFLLWTRPGVEYAALDTHVLKWMRRHGYEAPRSTPQNRKKYRELEKAFIAEAKKRGMTAREFDSKVWEEYSKYNEGGDAQ